MYADGRTALFHRVLSAEAAQWVGASLSHAEIVQHLHIDMAYDMDDFKGHFSTLLTGQKGIYYSFRVEMRWSRMIFDAMQRLKKEVRRGTEMPYGLYDLDHILSEMRLVKTEDEIQCMRRAAKASVKAHQHAMRVVKRVDSEAVLEAEMRYIMAKEGCRSLAYEPIVASGVNACTLHYTRNQSAIDPKGLILADVGGEYACYAADVTTTFPATGVFSGPQREIYSLVFEAQRAGFQCIAPGLPWNRIQETVVRVLTQGLCDLGLLQGSVDDLIAAQAYRAFYMHGAGHWLGLDVHDVGSYKVDGQWRHLEPGMVCTVEPGLYIVPGSQVSEQWWGIGVRIEDDLLVTNKGYDNLSAGLPRTVDEIEAWMK